MHTDPNEHGEAEQAANDPPTPEEPAILKPLNMVRAWLIASGILLVFVHGLELVSARAVVIEEVKKHRLQVPASQVENALLGVYLLAGIAMVLGVAYIVLGVRLKGQPAPVAMLCLGSYLLYQVVVAVLNPNALTSNIIFKLIVIFALAKAVHSALVCQREARATQGEPLP